MHIKKQMSPSVEDELQAMAEAHAQQSQGTDEDGGGAGDGSDGDGGDAGGGSGDEGAAAAAAAQEAPTFKLTDLLGEESDIKSIDELKPIIERGRGYDTVLGERDSFKQQVSELTTKLSQKVNPFANDEMAEFNAFAKETGNINYGFFKTLRNSEFEKMTPLQILIMKEQAADPDGMLTDADIKDALDLEYGMEKEDFSDIEDEDLRAKKEEVQERRLRANENRMKLAANRALTELKELKGKIQKVDYAAQVEQADNEMKEQLKQLNEQWNPHIGKVIDKIKEIKWTDKNSNNEDFDLFKYEMSQEEVQEFTDRITQQIVRNGKAPTEQTIQELAGMMQGVVILKNFSTIARKINDNAEARTRKAVEAEYANAGRPSGGGAGAGGGSADADANQQTEASKQKMLDMVDQGQI